MFFIVSNEQASHLIKLIIPLHTIRVLYQQRCLTFVLLCSDDLSCLCLLGCRLNTEAL